MVSMVIISVRVPAGNSWHTEMGESVESLTKGLYTKVEQASGKSHRMMMVRRRGYN